MNNTNQQENDASNHFLIDLDQQKPNTFHRLTSSPKEQHISDNQVMNNSYINVNSSEAQGLFSLKDSPDFKQAVREKPPEEESKAPPDEVILLQNQSASSNDYNNISNLKLPAKLPYEFSNRHVSRRRVQEDAEFLLEKETLEAQIKSLISKHLFIWDYNDRNFRFDLPETIFNERSLLRFQNYHQKSNPEKDRNLTCSQLKEIFLQGTITVESHVEGLPNVWHISRWIIKGLYNILDDFKGAISLCFFLLYKLKHRFSFDKENFLVSFPNSIYSIYEFLNKLINLILGLPSYVYNDKKGKEGTKLRTIIVNNFMKENPEFYLDPFRSNNLKNFILTMSNNFEEKWKEDCHIYEQDLYVRRFDAHDRKKRLYEIRQECALEYIDEYIDRALLKRRKPSEKRLPRAQQNLPQLKVDRIKSSKNNVIEMHDMSKKKPEEVNVERLEVKKEISTKSISKSSFGVLSSQKFNLNALKENENTTNNEVQEQANSEVTNPQQIAKAERIREFIKEFFKAHNIVSKHFSIQKILEDECINNAESYLKENHEIKIWVNEWKENQMRALNIAKLEAIQVETHENIIHAMNELPNARLLFEYMSNYYINADKMIGKLKRLLSIEKIPERVFTITFNILFPSKVDQTPDGKFTLVDFYDVRIPSSWPFWRFPLNFIRFFAWCNNIFILSYYLLTQNSFGIISFFKMDLYTDLKCNPETGALERSDKVYTLLSSIKSTCENISSSRKKFEDSPDESFFGKNCSRVFNITYNYLVKGSFIIFILLMAYPIGILLWSAFWLIVLILSPVLAAIGLIFYNMINLLIVDLDYQKFEIEFGLGLFPLFFYTLMIKVVFQFLLAVILCLFQPISLVLVFIFAIVRLILRVIYDCFMFLIIRIFALVPISDSIFAWRKSGPGLSCKYYNYLHIEDSLTIIHAQLERIELTYFKQKVMDELYVPLIRARYNLSDNLFQKCDLKFVVNTELDNSISLFSNILDYQIQHRTLLFPKVYNLKYHEHELNTLINVSREYVRDFITSHQMNRIFKDLSINPNAWGKLTERILIDAFGEQIMTSLEETDFRIEVKKEENSDFENLKLRIVEKSGLERFNDNGQVIKDKKLALDYEDVQIADIIKSSSRRLLFIDADLIKT